MIYIEKLKRLRGFLLPLILIGLWQYMSGKSAMHAYAFVPLQNLGGTLAELLSSGELALNFWGSLTRTGIGLVVGVSVGIALGVLMAFSKTVLTLVYPLYNAIRQVPLLGLTPLIGMSIGNGEEAKIFIISLAAFFPMLLNTYEGVRNVDLRAREVGTIYGFSWTQQLFKILLPAALPGMITGLLLAIPFAWITCIGGELLFNAGAGLGNMMMTAEMSSRMDIILICAIVVTLLGVAMNHSVTLVGNYLLRWRSPNR